MSLPAPPARGEDFYARVRAFKRQLLIDTITAHGGNRSQAGRALGLEYKDVWRLTNDLDITEAEIGPARQYHGPPPPDPAWLPQLRRMAPEMGCSRAAGFIGVDPRTVRRVARRHGITFGVAPRRRSTARSPRRTRATAAVGVA